RRRGLAEGVRELQGEHGEGDADEGLTDELGHRPQTERSLLPDLDEVIEESDDAEAAGQPQHEQTRGRRHGTGEQVSEQVGEDGGADDDDSAHGRGAALGRMRGRTVVTDELAVSLLDEHPDEQRGAHQREDERQTGCEQDGYHRALDTAAISSPRQRRPASREDLTRTVSPAASSAFSRSFASAAVATQVASLPQEPSRFAALKIGFAPSPTTIVRVMLSRT